MNKKKACIESLAAQENQEPVAKLAKYESNEATTFSSATDSGDSVGVSTVCDDAGTLGLDHEKQSSSPTTTTSGVQESVTGCDPLPPGARSSSLDFSKCSQTSHINYLLFTSEMEAVLRKNYHDLADYFDDATGVKLSCVPFRHCVLPNFVTSNDYVEDLESALLDLTMRNKNNDLYKFSQSRDLNHSKSSPVSSMRSMLNTVKDFISTVTEIPLNSKIDMFCSQYKYTDVLLCHDDELEERRIAFIYYLVPELWSASDGGTLDLFDADENSQPKSIVKSIVPKRNSFLFFEVSAKSFHQVAEVLSQDKTRLSLSGWFHGPPLPRPPAPVDALPPAVPYGSIEEQTFYAWFNPLYLAPEVQSDVRKRFEENSEIELTDFLQEEKYNELMAALQEERIDWHLLGPANKRNYYSLEEQQLPAVVSEFLHIMHSDAAFLVLSNLTGLKLHPLAPSSDDEDGATVNGSLGESSANGGASNPRCRSEVRKWEHGCYTLTYDTDMEIQDFALDTMMYIGCNKEWSFDYGGYTSYIAKGEEDELLSVCPSENSLALVYRDKDTMRFVKHLNHRVTSMSPPRFFEVNTVYYE